jgi:threonine dehydrogenase-like Zn-dependent dehydrogenase
MALVGRAVVLDKPNGTFEIVEAEVPEVQPGGMIVRQEMCGVCGTDAHLYRGHSPTLKYPLVMGHENVGIVERLGGEVRADVTGRPVKEGDRVYIVPGIRCGKCYYCTILGQPNLCLNSGGIGFRPYADQPIYSQGGYGDYIWMKEGVAFLRIDADPREVVTLEPLSVGVHIVSQVHIQPGDVVVVQGAEAIGLAAMTFAKLAGASKVIVVGAPKSRLDLAREFGADLTVDLSAVGSAEERIELVRTESAGGHGADVVFECTGVPAALPEGIEMTRRGGTYVVAGHFTDAGPVTLNPFLHLNRKNITLKGVWSSERSHFVRARAVVESGRFPFAKLVSHVVPLARVGEAIEAMSGRYVLDGQEVRKIAVSSRL